MSDWRVVTEKTQSPSEPIQSDWRVVPFESKEESFGEKLPRNIVSGLAQGGHELLNTPYNVAKNIEQQGKQFGKMVNKALPLEKYGIKQQSSNFSVADLIPHQQEYDFAQMLGQKGKPTFADKAIQGVSQYAPELLMGANALRGFVPHLTQRGASRRLRNARQLGIDQNMGNLDIDPHLIEDMRQYQPANTLPFRNQMDAAHTGNYQALFDLQSEVGREAAARARTLFSPAQRSHGRAGLQARNDLIEDMHRDMQLKGHHNVSNEFRLGQEDYRRFARFRPYRNAIAGAAISAAVAAALPKNALTNLIKKLVTHSNE